MADNNILGNDTQTNEMLQHNENLQNDISGQDNMNEYQSFDAVLNDEMINKVESVNETLTEDNYSKANANPLAEPPKKKSSKRIIGIAAAIVVFVCIAGIAAAKAAMPIMMPKVYIADAIKTTQKILVEEKKIRDDLIGADLTGQILRSEAVQTDFAFTLKNVGGEGAEFINKIIRGMGISGQTQRDQEGQKLLMSFAVNQNDLRLAGVEAYKNGAEIGITVPELFSQRLAVNLDTFVPDYNQSALFKLIGEPINEEEYNAFRKYLEDSSKPKISDELVKKVTGRSEELFKTAEVRYTGKSDVDVANEGKVYQTYEVIIKEAELKNYIKDLLKISFEDEAFINYVETVDTMQKASNGESFKQQIEELKNEINSTLEQAVIENLKVTLKIDDKKRIVESIYETVVSVDGESAAVKMITALRGSKFMTDSMKTEVSIEGLEGQMVFAVESNSNYGDKTDQVVHKIALSAEADKQSAFQLNLDMDYNTKAKEDNLALKAALTAMGQETFSASAAGTMNIDKSSKKLGLDMKNITLGINDGYSDYKLDFSGKYSVSAMKTSDIIFKQDNMEYVLNMTEEELMALGSTVSSKLEQLGSALIP